MKGRARLWRLLIVVACTLLAQRPARALDAERTIGQLTHVWYENQLPQGTVLSIAQRSNGSIWLATYGGLIHYSGGEFDVIDQRVASSLKSSAITSVTADPGGTLWVGTLNGGLYRSTARELERVELPARVESVFGIVRDGAGALMLTTNAGVVRMDATGARVLDADSGFPPRGFYRAIVADRSIQELTRDLAFFDADGVIATGQRTGNTATIEEIEEIGSATHLPLLVGSGVTKDNIVEILKRTNGVIVASSLKQGGVWWNPVDIERVKAFRAAAAPALEA